MNKYKEWELLTSTSVRLMRGNETMKKTIERFSELQEDEILRLVRAYLNKHKAWGGEMVQQDDRAQEDAVALAVDLADAVSFNFEEDADS